MMYIDATRERKIYDDSPAHREPDGEEISNLGIRAFASARDVPETEERTLRPWTRLTRGVDLSGRRIEAGSGRDTAVL